MAKKIKRIGIVYDPLNISASLLVQDEWSAFHTASAAVSPVSLVHFQSVASISEVITLTPRFTIAVKVVDNCP